MATVKARFFDFYHDVFLSEHRDPRNVAFHVFGTLFSLACLMIPLTSEYPWMGLLYPVVHATPGLVGHRLFERDNRVGDLRVNRKDFSPIWFIAANHVMTADLLLKGFYWRNSPPYQPDDHQ
jgi:hypothetical protein